jgi:integrase
MAKQAPREHRKFRFTVSNIKALKPQAKPVEYRDATLKGFFVRVSPAGHKSYYCQYRVGNQVARATDFCMGAVSDYPNPEEARQHAQTIQYNAKHKGIDPKAEKAAERRRKKQRKLQEAKDAEAHTLGSFIDDIYTDYAELHQRGGTAAVKRLKGAFSDLLGRKIDDIPADDITAWRDQLRKKGRTPQTTNRYMDDLRSCMNHALERGVIAVHPFDNIPRKKRRLKTEDDKRVRYLGQRDEHEDIQDEASNKIGERARLLKALDTQGLPKYMKPMVLLALHTGMRRGELFKLKWSDIDFRQKHIRLKAMNTKSNKTRYAYLNDVTDKLLREWRKAQGNVLNIDGLVFPNPVTGKPLTTVKRAWKTVVTKAQLQDFRLHDCRHDFASQLVTKGVPLYTVAELLGHSGVEITQRYAHLAPRHKADAVSLLCS